MYQWRYEVYQVSYFLACEQALFWGLARERTRALSLSRGFAARFRGSAACAGDPKRDPITGSIFMAQPIPTARIPPGISRAFVWHLSFFQKNVANAPWWGGGGGGAAY